MKNLVIVESPSKSKTIEKYLGKDYKVVSSKGHIRDLATKGKDGLGVDIENNFKPTYEISPDKRNTVRELKQLAKEAENIYLATDPDREGEAISWHLADVLGLSLNDLNRIEFHEITKNAVLNALDNPRTINMNLVKSQETRRILDRIIGFKISKLLQRKISSKSAGRVQSVALRIICDKEHEIENFVPEEYWTIKLDLSKGNKKLEVSLAKVDGQKPEIASEEKAIEIAKRIKESICLTDISSKEKKRSAYLPFITSSLQQEASSKLGFSSKKTMQVAQSLYEGVSLGKQTQGLITYMRTDSTRLSNEFIGIANKYIENNYGKNYLGKYRVKNDANSQDAHEAIRPTSLDNEPDKIKDYLTNDQYKLYRFIYFRALASLMADACFKTTTYSFEDAGLLFQTSGSIKTFDGFLKAYEKYDSSKDTILPDLNKNDECHIDDIKKEQHFTEAPSRYTEAKLIKALEEDGVGRPSTYATIIDTIQQRSYVELKKAEDSKTKYFYPTDQGLLTDDSLKKHFIDIINIEYTANMEKMLDEIADANLDNIKVLNEFENTFEPILNNAYSNMEKAKPTKTGEVCPMCGSDLVIRKGKYGEFVACSNYPKCKYIKKEEKEKTIICKCPKCDGNIIERPTRKGKIFWGCDHFPKCKYASWYKPTGQKCEECGDLLVDRNGQIVCPTCDGE